ncbi:unnamed protein product [Spirodela intermedia]|uniref:O-fucosyltransferase family protein n=1 Tax=Spirodela intermedia TaxID=51605 RepID=A0A7I8JD63_SPIIN|nr:unnamed protein product [Spirodela intermedia]CAA6668106.1 unnamed protein product [Spirodela intermedia]
MFHTSKIKLATFVGIILSVASLIVHLYLANSSSRELIYYRLPVDNLYGPRFKFKALWGPVGSLESLQPYANPRKVYPAPSESNNGYIYAKIYGGFERIRSSMCDLVTVARLLNATLVIPEIQASLQSKGISSKFKSFSYLYNEAQFIEALTKDVTIIGSLPRSLKEYSASPSFYLDEVLPKLKGSKVIGLVIADGGCLQSVLPPTMVEYQRLRCKVAFMALDFRPEIKALGTQIVERLRASGKPYLAYHPGLVKETWHSMDDLHTELIQHRRKQMIKKGILHEELSVDSFIRKRNGSCPLMPEEVGLLLRAVEYPPDTIIYLAGSETFGGQRVLLPLRAMYGNTVDRSSLCGKTELSSLAGPESPLPASTVQPPPPKTKEELQEEWKKAGPRPRPLPPPPGRPFYRHEKEGWYGWLAEAEVEPDPTTMDLRMNAHRLLWDALDYHVSVEADAFFPGFNDDGSRWPDFSSLVMGHRLHKSASKITYRPDRRRLAELFGTTSSNRYHPSRNWTLAMRESLKKGLGVDGLAAAADRMTEQLPPPSFLSHPLPGCSCRTSPAAGDQEVLLGGVEICPEWMRPSPVSVSLRATGGKDDGSEEGGGGEDEVGGEFPPETVGGSKADAAAAGPSEQDEEMDPDD